MRTGSNTIGVHSGPIYAAAFATDGDTVVAGGRDGVVREWPASSARAPVASIALRQYVTAVWSGAVGPLRAAAAGDAAHVWRRGDRRPRHSLGHRGVETIAVDAAETRLFSAGEKGLARLWSMTSGRRLTEVSLPTSRLMDAQWLDPDDTVLVAGADGQAFILDGADLSLRQRIDLRNNEGPAYRMRRSADGSLFAAAVSFPGMDSIASPHLRTSEFVERYEVAVWDPSVAGPDPGENLVGHLGWIGALAFSPDSALLASGAIDGRILIWDPYGRRAVHEYQHDAGSIHALAFAPDGRRLLAATSDGVLRLWDLDAPDHDPRSAPPYATKLHWVNGEIDRLLGLQGQRALELAIDTVLGVGADPFAERLSMDELASLNAGLNIRQERAFRQGDNARASRLQFILGYAQTRFAGGLAKDSLSAILSGTQAGAADGPEAAAPVDFPDDHALGVAVLDIFRALAAGEIDGATADRRLDDLDLTPAALMGGLEGVGLFGPGQLPADPGGAIEVACAAHRLASRIGPDALSVDTGINLVSVLGQSRRTAEGLAVAEALLTGITDLQARAELLSMLGNLHENSGNPRAAIRALSDAAAAVSAVDPEQHADWVNLQRTRVYVNLACIHQNLGDYAAERIALNAADQASLKAQDPEARAVLLVNLAGHYMAVGDLDSAETTLSGLLGSPSLPKGVRANIEGDRAQIAADRGDFTVAERQGEHAYRLASEVGRPDIGARAARVLARTAFARDDIEEGFHRLRVAMELATLSGVVGLEIAVESDVALLTLEHGDADGGYRLLQLVFDRVLQRRAALDLPGQGAAIHGRIASLTERLVAEAMRRGEVAQAWGYAEAMRAFLLRRSMADRDADWLDTISDPSSAAGLAAVRDGLDSLGPGALLVSYMIGVAESWAFVMRAAGDPVALPLQITQTGLEAAEKRFRREVADHARYGDIGESWLEGVGPLMEPLDPYLRADDHLIIVPSGELFALPFAAMPLGGVRLGDRCAISIVPSAAWVARPSPTRGPPQHPVVLGTDFLDEAEAVSRLLAVAPLISPRQEAALGALQGADLVHITAHGAYCDPAPELSGVVLGKAAEVEALFTALARSPHARTEADRQAISRREAVASHLLRGDDFEAAGLAAGALVVLSACESGVVALDAAADPVGLLRGLLIGGAGAVISSQWRVDPGATAALMTALYQAMKDEPRLWSDPAEALRRAQHAVAAGHRHPFFWAGFYVTGGLYAGIGAAPRTQGQTV